MLSGVTALGVMLQRCTVPLRVLPQLYQQHPGALEVPPYTPSPRHKASPACRCMAMCSRRQQGSACAGSHARRPAQTLTAQTSASRMARTGWCLCAPRMVLRGVVGIVKLSQKIVHLCSKERTIGGFVLVRAPVFSLFPLPQLSSRGRRLGAIFP